MQNNDSYNNAGSNGIGFFGLLGIAFIVMKCLNQITWSWVWVLAPLWMPIAVVFLIYFIAFIYSVLKVMSRHKKEVKKDEENG